ncbi:MAG: peptidoglycan recognition family protein, partial [Chloroflexota bacterium]
MMYVEQGTKLGIHAQLSKKILFEHIDRAVAQGTPFPVLKTTQEHTVLKEVKRRSPSTITVARAIAPTDGMQGVADIEGEEEVEWWADEVLKPLYEFAEHNPDFQDYVDVWEFINEADPVGDEGYHNLGWVMRRCVEKAFVDFPDMAWGIASCNMGTPEWSEMVAFIDSGVFEAGDVVLCLHEGVPKPVDAIDKWHSSESDDPDAGLIPGAPSVPEHGGALYGRVTYWHQLLGDERMPPVIITEAYLHAYGDNGEIRRRAEWVDELYSQLWYVVGWLPFTYSPTERWEKQDYTPAYDGLLDYMSSVAGRENAPHPGGHKEPEEPMDWREEAILVSKALRKATGINWNPDHGYPRWAVQQPGHYAPAHTEYRFTAQDGTVVTVQGYVDLSGTHPDKYLVYDGGWRGMEHVEVITDGEPDDMFLAVEPLSQRDPRWANVVLGQDTGHGVTIGGWGCLMTAYCVMARFLGLTDDLPPEFQKHLVATGGMTAQFTNNHALAKAYPDKIESFGWKTRADSTMHGSIRERLQAGMPVPARVDFVPETSAWEQHWVLLIGVLPGDDYYIADPWTGEIGKLSDIYPIAGSDVLEALYYGWKDEPDSPLIGPPGTIDLVGQLSVHDELTYKTRTLDEIKYITIHHSATRNTISPEAFARYHITPREGAPEGWPGIGYGYLVYEGGEIVRVNELTTVSYHDTQNRPSVGVCLVGTFSNESPPSKQLAATRKLVDWLKATLPGVMARTHRSVTGSRCPGETWPSWWQAATGETDPVEPEPPAQLIDLRRFKIAHPDAWRVVKHVDDSGRETNEDVQDMELGGGLFVRRKNQNGEWHYRDNLHFYLFHDTSPDADSNGTARVYTLYKDGIPGAPKSLIQQRVGETWREGGKHRVKFRAKDDCRALAENSGEA